MSDREKAPADDKVYICWTVTAEVLFVWAVSPLHPGQ